MSQPVVRRIDARDHLGFLAERGRASFLQTPAWGEVKREWRHESLGWFRGGTLVGVGLVLFRDLPRVRRALAYLPEGPVLDWADPELSDLLAALAKHLGSAGAFAIRIGPPVATRSWSAETVKRAIAEPRLHRLRDVPADDRSPVGEHVVATLRAGGWQAQASDNGFGAGQPQYVFQLPLAGRDEAALLAGMNQLWRRNIKRADRAGVTVSLGGPADLAAFHTLYAETAERDGFRPRPLAYFEQMVAAMSAEDPERIRLYLAHHEDVLVAATTLVRVGAHAWYSYGASSTEHREVRGSNAVQWQMIRDSLGAGAEVYDLRGITDTVDPDDPHVGLLQFKAGTGGEAVEYVGEWDLPLNRPLYAAFRLYMSRRG